MVSQQILAEASPGPGASRRRIRLSPAPMFYQPAGTFPPLPGANGVPGTGEPPVPDPLSAVASASALLRSQKSPGPLVRRQRPGFEASMPPATPNRLRREQTPSAVPGRRRRGGSEVSPTTASPTIATAAVRSCRRRCRALHRPFLSRLRLDPRSVPAPGFGISRRRTKHQLRLARAPPAQPAPRGRGGRRRPRPSLALRGTSLRASAELPRRRAGSDFPPGSLSRRVRRRISAESSLVHQLKYRHHSLTLLFFFFFFSLFFPFFFPFFKLFFFFTREAGEGGGGGWFVFLF